VSEKKPNSSKNLSKHELDRRLKEATMLKQIVSTAGAPLEPVTVLNVICAELVEVVGVEHAGFARLDDDGQALTVVSEFGLRGAINLGLQIGLEGNEITKQVISTRQPIGVFDAQNDPRMGVGREATRAYGLSSLLIVPIISGERVVGTLGLDSFEPREFNQNEIDLVVSASRAAAPLLENAQLFERLRVELVERTRTEDELRRSRALYQELVNSLEGIVWESEFREGDFICTFVSRQAERVLGYSVEEFLGPRLSSVWMKIHHPDDWDYINSRLQHASISLEPVEVESRAIDINGRMHWFQDRITATRLPYGGVRLRGLIVDVTEHKRAVRLERDRNLILEMVARGTQLEDILRVICEMLTAQFSGAACAIHLNKGSSVYLAASHLFNREFKSLLNDGAQLNNHPILAAAQHNESREMNDLQNDPQLSDEFRKVVTDANFKSSLTIPITIKNQSEGALSLYSPNSLEQHSRAVHAAADLAAIAVNRQTLMEQLEFQATHDPLTELPNRLLYHDRLAIAMARADREKHKVGVMYVDLDKFKQINDLFSHATGDELLRSISKQLIQAVRSSDSVARLGGDEFGVIVCNLASRSDAEQVAEKIAKEVNTSVRIGSKAHKVTASIGIAIYPDDGTDADTLYRVADSDMYRNKALSLEKK
jgi:diguanylate cyclase (GGDEF)-like protein/PAS domain S-box-containing protein